MGNWGLDSPQHTCYTDHHRLDGETDMSKHYVEAYSTRSYPHAGLGSGQSVDWRVWYTREYSDGLKSCKKRIANLSQKYPNTVFRLRSRDHWVHSEEIVMVLLDGKDVAGDF